MNKLSSYVRKYNELFKGYDEHMFDSLSDVSFIKSNKVTGYRINLVVPNLCAEKYFGGVATAIRFGRELSKNCDGRFRIIADEVYNKSNIPQLCDYQETYADEDIESELSTCRYRNKKKKELRVEKHDIFILTYWTTMYNFNNVYEFQSFEYGVANNLIYLIQDFEPSFFKWSAYYLLAESTYRLPHVTAIFNTEGLMNYMNRLGYSDFELQYYFEPQLNGEMKKQLFESKGCLPKRKNQLIIYGRPRNARNCFPLIIEALKKVISDGSIPDNWEYLSIGVKHNIFKLGKNKKLVSLGKLSLDEYCEILLESKVGISLMCSPHPSYPPLEMTAFGVTTITNGFIDKNIEKLADNLVVLESTTIDSLAIAIKEAVHENEKGQVIMKKKIEYFMNNQSSEFKNIIPKIIKNFRYGK